jgi:predicted short-subunit dehydrogenase-like oxidoreductase (DUF2520 family)
MAEARDSGLANPSTGGQATAGDGPAEPLHAHGDVLPIPHRHPHPPDDPSGHPRIGIVGPGHAGLALGVAFSSAGWPVAAVAGRDPERRERFHRAVPTARPVGSARELVDAVDLVFLTVPDDAIADVAASFRLYGGQAVVHTSGALPASVLAPARAAGTMAASFHPLVAFAELERSLSALHGATIALEGDEPLLALLGQLATDLGAQPVRLPPGGKAAYHAAAVLSAGGFIGLLDAIAELARGAGLDERQALAIFGPLVRQSLGNAEELGIAAALTGPMLRGDAGTVHGHLDAMRRLAPGSVALYVAAARRELALAEARGDLAEVRADELRRLLDADPAAG